ncbi:MAG: oligosaccharide flippase family protein [bacterium]|nr:oligosaccharide flippase family protein [bacterium]
MRTSIILVLFKTPKNEIKRLKKEVKSLKLKSYKLFLIDNSKINRGYAGALNKGIKLSKNYNPDYYIFGNDDISFKNLSGKALFDASKFYDLWGFTLKQNGKLYYGGELDKLRLSGGLVLKKPKKRFSKVDFISGSLMIIKKEVIQKTGYFDESYFLYYEEVDYCERARLNRFKIGLDSKYVYNHFERSDRNTLKEFYLKRSRLKFLLKYGSLKQKLYELIRIPKTIYENKTSPTFNFLSLNISTLFNKLLSFVLFLFLLKYLSVDDYGIYTLVWAHVNILSSLADFGTTTYGIVKLPLVSKNKYNYFYSLRLVTSLIALIITSIFAFILNLNYLVILFILLTSPIILSNAFSGTYLIILSLKNKQYLSSIVSVLFNLILILTLIFLTITTKSLIYIFIAIGFFYIGYTILNYFLSKKEFPTFSFKFNYKVWKNIIKKSFIYVAISLFAGLYFKLDLYLLNFLKGSEAIGIYSAGFKFFEAFIFIAGSYSIASLPTLSKLYALSKRVFISKVKKDFILLTFLGYSIALIGYITAPFVLPNFFQRSYMDSIEVFRIVIFSLPFMLGTTVFLNSLYILKKAYIVLTIFILQTVFNFIFNYIYIPKFSYFASSYITLLGEFLTTFVVALLFIKLVKNENRN